MGWLDDEYNKIETNSSGSWLDNEYNKLDNMKNNSIKAWLTPVNNTPQPTTVKQQPITIKPTTARQTLESAFGKADMGKEKSQQYQNKIKNLIGEQAYNELPKYGGYPGQKTLENATNSYKGITYIGKTSILENEAWAKKHPEADKKLTQLKLGMQKYDPVTSAAIGFVDSATLGLAEELKKKQLNGYSPAANAKAQQPLAYTGGNIAGYMLPGAASEKVAATALKPIAKKITSTVAKKALQGAVSGGTLGVAEGLIKKESPSEIAKNTLTYAGFGAGLNALPSGINAIVNKIKTGKAITEAETATLKTASNVNPELLQLPEVKRLLLPEKATSKIELGAAKPQPETVKPKTNFYATERNVAKSVDDFKTPPKGQLALPEGKPQKNNTRQDMIDLLRRSVNEPDYRNPKRIEQPFAVTKGETKYGNKKTGVAVDKNTDRLSDKFKAQNKANELMKFGEYNTIGQKYDFINSPAAVKENKSIYAAAKGQKERPFVEVRGKTQNEINAEIKTLEAQNKSNIKNILTNEKGSGIIPFGNELRRSAQGSNYVSETASKIKSTKDATKGGQSLLDKFRTNFIDNQKRIKDFSTDAKQNLRTDVLANNSRNVSGTVDYILRDGLVDKTGKKIGSSYKDIITKVPKNQENVFNDYMLHRHNISRMSEGKPVFSDDITAEMSANELKAYEANYPEFKKTAEEYDKFFNNFMETWGVDSGLISKDTWLKLKEKYPNYVPTYRVFSEVERIGQGGQRARNSFVNTSATIKKATGSKRNIINPLEKTMELIDKTVKTAKYNEVGQSIVEALRNDKDLSSWAEIVKDTKQGLLDDINLTLKDEGIEGIMDKFSQQFDEVFNKKPSGNNIVRVMENGEPVYVQIKDPELLKAITGLTRSTPGAIEGFVRKHITNRFKSLITGKNPIFAVKNISRDIPTAYINGGEKNPVKFLNNLTIAAKEMTTGSQMYQEFKAIGGKYSSYFKSDLNNLYKGPSNLEKFNTFIESLPRYAEYRRTVLKGGNNYISKMQGLYNSAEVTTNFARHGNLAKSIDAFVPYFNPSVQGLDKFIRQVKTNPLATVGKSVFVVTVPNVALYFMNKDNPYYKDLDNRTKDNYFVIPNMLDKDNKGNAKTFIKIPKAREYGAIFGAFLERTIKMANGEPEPFKGYAGTLKTNFMPTTSTIASGLISLKTNKDFAGRTIVPANLKNLSPRYQYDETTTEAAKFFGDKLNFSPKQLDYLAKSYLGVLAQIGQPLMTKQTYSAKDSLNNKVTGTALNVISRNFTADPLYSNDAVNTFYNNKNKLDVAKNDFKKKGVKSGSYNSPLQKQFSNAAELISKKYDSIDEINQNKNLSIAEKKKKIDLIRKDILELAKKNNDKLKK